MRERLYVIALAVAQKFTAEALVYHRLKLACGDKPVFSDYGVVDCTEFVEASKDDYEPCTIWHSVLAIVCGGPMYALLKLLCVYQRHKLRKIHKAEEA